MRGSNNFRVKFFQLKRLPFFHWVSLNAYHRDLSVGPAFESLCLLQWTKGKLMLCTAPKMCKTKGFFFFMSNFSSMHKLRTGRLKQTDQNFFLHVFLSPLKSFFQTTPPSSTHTYIHNPATTTMWNKHRWCVAWVHPLTSEISMG